MTHALVTRFAPSPTGRLHLGHAYSALLAHEAARASGGRFILRIEDIDPARCQAAFVQGIFEDLTWLGLRWETPVRHQSRHMEDYRQALRQLDEQGLLYPCFCTRRDIAEEIARAPSAPHGPDGPLYPGLCRALSGNERAARLAAGAPYALRLDAARAIAHAQRAGRWPRAWHDAKAGRMTADLAHLGDVVLARKDTPTSYHLAVTLDDALAGVTHVVRGEDLFHATHVHVLLQAVLGLPTPTYHHHPLLTDDKGRRLAKRDQSMTLAHLRAAGLSPQAVRARLGL
ncbi:MAG: tRNA glutamyl-Q(34) synthetase GluQRS [Pseudomonadota bacterium]